MFYLIQESYALFILKNWVILKCIFNSLNSIALNLISSTWQYVLL